MAAGTADSATVATPHRKHEQVLPARPDQVRVARAFLATVLANCPAADDAVLCISELATNSYAPRGALLYPRRSREELKGGSWA
jgi:hypothetical protein